MKEYVIEKTVGAPDWTKVPELQVDNVCWLPDAGGRMEQQREEAKRRAEIREKSSFAECG